MGFSIKMELQSDPELMQVVRSAVQECASMANFNDEDCRMITLAVDEALTNIIRHAYGNRHNQTIRMMCNRNDRELEFILEDSGTPADLAKIRSKPLGEMRPGGLGTHIMAKIMDVVEYEPLPDRNRVRLVKYRNQSKAGG